MDLNKQIYEDLTIGIIEMQTAEKILDAKNWDTFFTSQMNDLFDSAYLAYQTLLEIQNHNLASIPKDDMLYYTGYCKQLMEKISSHL